MTGEKNDADETGATTADAETRSSHTPSTHKVLGELSETDASGVIGRNTSNTGVTYGVFGETQSSNAGAVGVLANAPNGGTGMQTTSSGSLALNAVTTGSTAVKAVTDGQGYNALHGENTATTGWSWGVRGVTNSAAAEAYGVRGLAHGLNGSPKGVGGQTSGEEDGAAGVYGEAVSNIGAVYGVHGETNSTDNVAAGVLGESPGSGANGVMGLANVSTPADRADEAGVYGETESSPGYGVFGLNSTSSGTYAEGVYGRTSSPESAAITGENTAGGIGVKSDGPLEVVGHTDVSTVGLSAYRSSLQIIIDTTTTTVVFDATNADHFGGYDTSTGQYTIQEAGDYHVSFTIDWQTTFDAGVHIDYELQINGSTTGGIQADTTVGTNGQRVCRNFSRTLFGLSQGDTLEVAVSQNSGTDADIFGSGQETYLTLYKVG